MKCDERDILFLKKALVYLKPFLKDIIFVFICILISSGLNLVQPLISRVVIDQGLVNKNIKVVVIYSLLTFAIIFVIQGFDLLQTKLYASVYAKYQFKLFHTAFKKMVRFRLEYFTSRNSVEIISNLSTDIMNVSKISDRSSFMIIDQIFRMLSGIIGLCIISWKLAVLVLCIAPLKYLIVNVLFKTRKKTIDEYLERNRQFYSWIGDIINGIREIKLFVLQRFETGRFVKKQRVIVQSNVKLALVSEYNQCAEMILFGALNCLLYILGAMLIVKNELTVGGLFSFITYSTFVTGPLSAMINLKYNYADFLPSAKRFFTFLESEPEECPQLCGTGEYLRLGQSKGHIRFENISFSYSKDREILKNISFEILPREKVAITGANGSGKTTLLNLLLRFYTPNSGKIYLDNQDIQQIKLDDYRRNFSVVSQDPYLFNTTITDNIIFNSNKNIQEVIGASVKAGADSFIDKLPQGYDAIVGQNGAHLSGGEKQKIAVSRVFINDSPIIVFDEATSNFDAFSDDYLNKVIFSELSDKTVIVITHKSGILKYMDKVLGFSEGELVY